VSDQFYKLTSLMRDDYASMLVAEEIARHPDQYQTRHDLNFHPDFDPLIDSSQPGACAIEISPKLESYLPRLSDQCAALCVRLAEPGEWIVWVGLRDMARLIDMKARTSGRNTDQFGDMNFYTNLRPPRPVPGWGDKGRPRTLPRRANYGLLVHDAYRSVSVGAAAHLRISQVDYMRAIADVERPEAPKARRVLLRPQRPARR
jgi:hypothetical protein